MVHKAREDCVEDLVGFVLAMFLLHVDGAQVGVVLWTSERVIGGVGWRWWVLHGRRDPQCWFDCLVVVDAFLSGE